MVCLSVQDRSVIDEKYIEKKKKETKEMVRCATKTQGWHEYDALFFLFFYYARKKKSGLKQLPEEKKNE